MRRRGSNENLGEDPNPLSTERSMGDFEAKWNAAAGRRLEALKSLDLPDDFPAVNTFELPACVESVNGKVELLLDAARELKISSEASRSLDDFLRPLFKAELEDDFNSFLKTASGCDMVCLGSFLAYYESVRHDKPEQIHCLLLAVQMAFANMLKKRDFQVERDRVVGVHQYLAERRGLVEQEPIKE